MFELPKRRPGQWSSIRWQARGTVVLWQDRRDGVPPYPAPPPSPPRRAPPRPDRPVVCPGFGFDRFVHVNLFMQGMCKNIFFMPGMPEKQVGPGHALHEKGLERKERRRSTGQQPGRKSASRPGDEPVVNRGFCSSIGLHRISLVRASGESLRRRVFDALENTRVSLGIDPQGSVCTGCCTGCRVFARVTCRCTRHRLE